MAEKLTTKGIFYYFASLFIFPSLFIFASWIFIIHYFLYMWSYLPCLCFNFCWLSSDRPIEVLEIKTHFYILKFEITNYERSPMTLLSLSVDPLLSKCLSCWKLFHIIAPDVLHTRYVILFTDFTICEKSDSQMYLYKPLS